MKVNTTIRVYHRYLGFFLAGIMAIYSISGIVLIFRDTDFLKSDRTIERTFPPGFKTDELGRALRIRDFKITKEDGDVVYFEQGTFDRQTGLAQYTSSELPRLLEKLTRIHKASTKEPLFFLNIFFGLSLLFFVVSSFWMFLPKSEIFKKGLYFTLGGIILTLLLLFI